MDGVAALVLCAAALLGSAYFVEGRASAPAGTTSEGEQLVRKSDCLSCHAIDHKVVGPSFNEVAKRYMGKAGAQSDLVSSIRDGGSGRWGKLAMTPHNKLSNDQIKTMVDWILSLRAEANVKQAPPEDTYTYQGPDGKTVTASFPIFQKGHEKDQMVTDALFNGWLQFNSTCFRCHGVDATGSSFAPDLRKSLRDGMTKQQFISMAMVGAKAKGMPSWAGFYDDQELTQIYQYVEARTLGLVPDGRPKSSTD